MTKALEWIRKGDCIICTSHAPISTGYPAIRRGGRLMLVHRIVCERKHGKLGALHSLHSCDTPSCINPLHLSPGTSKDNMRQKHARGRANTAMGSKSGKAVLDESIARKIFEASGAHRRIAEIYGTDHRTVGRIKRGEAWAHIWK